MLVAIWALLLALRLIVEAHWGVLGVLALFTLPGFWDLLRNPQAGLSLTADRLRWHAGRRAAEVSLSEVARVRFDTRLDFSVRVTLVLKQGGKLRLPFESTPPHRSLEEALQARGVPTERHHFTFTQ